MARELLKHQQNISLHMFRYPYTPINLERPNLKPLRYMYNKRPERYQVGTVHYQNPFMNEYVEIDQYGCISVQKRDKTSNNKEDTTSTRKQQGGICESCQIVSRISTKQSGTHVNEVESGRIEKIQVQKPNNINKNEEKVQIDEEQADIMANKHRMIKKYPCKINSAHRMVTRQSLRYQK